MGFTTRATLVSAKWRRPGCDINGWNKRIGRKRLWPNRGRLSHYWQCSSTMPIRYNAALDASGSNFAARLFDFIVSQALQSQDPLQHAVERKPCDVLASSCCNLLTSYVIAMLRLLSNIGVTEKGNKKPGIPDSISGSSAVF